MADGLACRGGGGVGRERQVGSAGANGSGSAGSGSAGSGSAGSGLLVLGLLILQLLVVVVMLAVFDFRFGFRVRFLVLNTRCAYYMPELG